PPHRSPRDGRRRGRAYARWRALGPPPRVQPPAPAVRRCGARRDGAPSPRSSPRRTRTRAAPRGAPPAPHARPGAPPRLTRSSRAEQRSVPELAGAVAHLVPVDVLDLHVLEDAVHAELAADPALLVPSEGRRDRQHVVLVDPHRAGAHALRHLHRLVVV